MTIKPVETLDPETKTGGGGGDPRKRMRHIVELVGPERRPIDRCLCGYIWDQVFVAHNGEICQACVDEQRRRQGAKR